MTLNSGLLFFLDLRLSRNATSAFTISFTLPKLVDLRLVTQVSHRTQCEEQYPNIPELRHDRKG